MEIGYEKFGTNVIDMFLFFGKNCPSPKLH